ncbi:MAG: potassium transporter TrkA [Candidatus Tectimicrobiota bacterium]|nr:MAG: potassium transporter TrkA [Candidatus Tectomicrobia bacterium]
MTPWSSPISASSLEAKEATILDTVLVLTTFGVLALAAKDLGQHGQRLGLPLISGFLLTGVLVGPYALGLVEREAVARLRFVDEGALAFIAFAAGGELELAEVRRFLRRIATLIAGQIVAVLVLGTAALLLLAGFLPFLQGWPTPAVLTVSVLGAVILLARSPSSAYALIKELRARGPFTQTVLSVTVLMDAVVILLFAAAVSTVAVVLEGARFQGGLLLLVGFEIALDIALGVLIGQGLCLILARRLPAAAKSALMLLLGYGVFLCSRLLHAVPLGSLRLFSEPLLVGMTAGCVVTNASPYKAEFRKLVEDASLTVFVFFFTLVGISLELDFLARTWPVALALLGTRALGLVLGSLAGGLASGWQGKPSLLLGFTFLTQAGVSVGLAKEAAVEFPAWGEDFATLMIAVVVINQLIGPPLFKWAFFLAGEAHPRGTTTGLEGGHRVLIVGIDDQSLALARQLQEHGWPVTLADTDAKRLERAVASELHAKPLATLTPEALRAAGAERAEVILCLLDDESNYAICEAAYEHFATAHLIAYVHERPWRERFRELGVLIVEPSTALVNLLYHVVRSPTAGSLFLELEGDQDVIDLVVSNRALHGLALRDLRLPADALILSVRRRGQLLVSHGYTRLEVGDEVTVMGTPQALAEVQWLLEAYPYS